MIQFTGNWYIDMGILGMLNLLREQLPEKELNDLRSLNGDELKIMFTKSYFKYFIKRKNEKLQDEEDSLAEGISKLKNNKRNKNLIKKKEQLKEITDQKEYYRKILEVIKSKPNWIEIKNGIQETSDKYNVTQTSKKRIPFSSAFYTNYKFFNNSSKLENQLNDWEKFILNGKIDDELLEGTLNKLTVGFNDYPNIFYSKPELTNFISAQNNLHIPLICHFRAYGSRKLAGKYYFFYSPEINFCFSVNKRLQTLIDNVSNNDKLLSITWQAVFDSLYEYKSDWVLQNMYLISYSTINNQQRFENIEFIGLSKINATVIANDNIREDLNQAVFTSLRFKNDGLLDDSKSERKWLIQEIIENSSLLDLIFRITNIHTSPKKENKNFDYRRFSIQRNKIITALSVCIHKIVISEKEMQAFRRDTIYQGSKFKNIAEKIIETKNLIKWNNKLYYDLFVNDKEKKLSQDEKREQSEFDYLIRLIKRKENNRFINFIIQKMLIAPNNEKNQNAKNWLTSFLFKYIISNPYWQYYALGLIFKNFNQISNYEQSSNNE